MKIEEREIMKPTRSTCYIAYDGKQFDNYNDCERYEACAVESYIQRLYTVRSTGGMIPCDGYGYHPADDEYIWIYVRNHEDIMTMRSILEIYPSIDKVGDMDIGQWLCMEIDYENNIYINPLKNSIEYIREFLKFLGYDIAISVGANHPCKNEKPRRRNI